MVGRIICYLFFGCLIIAFVLSFAGIQNVGLGNGFRSWLLYVNNSFTSWSFKIPKVPDIPLLKTSSDIGSNSSSMGFASNDFNMDGKISLGEFFAGLGDGSSNSQILNALKGFVNVFVTVMNFFVAVINVLIVVVNTLIQVIQFVLTMVWCIKDIPQYLSSDTWASFNDDLPIWWWQDIEDIIESIRDGTFNVG